MKISIGADHRGLTLKKAIIEHFGEHDFLDVGTFNQERTDYPIFAKKVCVDVLNDKAQLGILICGSGVGMSIAANRHKKIYAALCWLPEVARCAKAHDDANVLVLPADFISSEVAIKIIVTWLDAKFEGGRYQNRLNIID